MLFPRRNKKIIIINNKTRHGAPAAVRRVRAAAAATWPYAPRSWGGGREGGKPGGRGGCWRGGGGGGRLRSSSLRPLSLFLSPSTSRRVPSRPGSYLPPRTALRATRGVPAEPARHRSVAAGFCFLLPPPCRERREGRAGGEGRRAGPPALPAPSRQRRAALHVPGSPAASALCTARTRHRPPRPITARRHPPRPAHPPTHPTHPPPLPRSTPPPPLLTPSLARSAAPRRRRTGRPRPFIEPPGRQRPLRPPRPAPHRTAEGRAAPLPLGPGPGAPCSEARERAAAGRCVSVRGWGRGERGRSLGAGTPPHTPPFRVPHPL